MDIIECYRLLELTSTASLEEVKSSYRRLARQWHPDINPNNDHAHDQFIRVTAAYKVLLKVAAARPAPTVPRATAPQPPPEVPEVTVTTAQPTPKAPPSPPDSVAPPPPPITTPPAEPHPPETTDTALSFADRKLKFDTYRQLEDLIKRRSLPRAIAIIEALQARLPNDPEVRQWQAIIYQRWGRQLIEERKLSQARAYLNKALKTDPHNKSLGTEIAQDFRLLERTYSA
jgi:tetratricopeptide (TPR) repeat protein